MRDLTKKEEKLVAEAIKFIRWRLEESKRVANPAVKLEHIKEALDGLYAIRHTYPQWVIVEGHFPTDKVAHEITGIKAHKYKATYDGGPDVYAGSMGEIQAMIGVASGHIQSALARRISKCQP